MQITECEAVDIIRGSAGKILTVDFIKRTNGEFRSLNCRLGRTVRKGLAGGPAAYNPRDHGLVWVYRMAGDKTETPGNRRSIPYEGIQRVKIAGKEYIVKR